MSITEEAGKVASGVVDALKSSPSCLAAILMAALFASMVFFSAKDRDRQFHERQLALMQACFPSPIDRYEQEREQQRERARARAQREREG